MHLCSDAQKPRSVKTAPAVLTYRTSCINATDSKCRRAIFNRDSDFAAPPVLVYRPKGSADEDKTEEWKGAPPVPARRARGFKIPTCFLSQNPHLLSESRYEIIQTDLNRKVGIIGMRREDFALVTGSDFRHHLILYEEECLKKR